MHVNQWIGFCQFQFTGFWIQVFVIGTDIYYISYEHVMRTQRNYFFYTAFYA